MSIIKSCKSMHSLTGRSLCATGNIHFTLKHTAIGSVGDCEYVRRILMALLSLVVVDYLVGVDGKLLVGIDDHAKEARVGLQRESLIKMWLQNLVSSFFYFTTTGRLLNHFFVDI